MNKHFEALRLLATLQRRLVARLADVYPEYLRGDPLLFGVPSKSSMGVDGVQWSIAKHGVGACLTRNAPSPSLVVDMHVDIANACRVDAWRLQQFIESQGGEITYEEAQSVIHHAVEEGLVAFRGSDLFEIVEVDTP